MVVLKFGGSSVGHTRRFKNAVAIVEKYRASSVQLAIIASALSGVTDRLVEASTACVEDSFDEDAFIQWIHERHSAHAAVVLKKKSESQFCATLADYLKETRETLQTIKNASEEERRAAAIDTLLAVGERLSVHLFSLALEDLGETTCPVDAATLIQTDASFGAALVHFDETYTRIQAWHEALPKGTLPVVTGFIGCAPDGQTTTLGRGGSDYSASILAAGLKAHKLERWTDVDGVYTSDPRRDPGARKLDYIVMEDALSWNKAGKMGLHRKALDPLIEARVPLFVRSIDKPDNPGTEVHPRRYQQAVAC